MTKPAPRYHLIRSDGRDLGTFDTRDEAEGAAEEDAGEMVRWMRSLAGTESKPRRGYGYAIRKVSG